MARKYVTAGALRDAARPSPPHKDFDGEHHHGHSAYGHESGDDDGRHSHPHSHDGDHDHDHEHEMTDAYRPDAPGAVLDSLPCARSWGSFLSAISDPDDASGGPAAMRRAVAAARPSNAGMAERIPSEGGFLVPERLRAQILSYMTDEIIWPRSTPVPMDSLTVPVPVLDNPSQANSVQALGGLTFTFTAESAAITPSTPNFGAVALEARKAAAFLQSVPNELVDDSAAFTEVFLPQVIAKGYGWFRDDVLISGGTGVGEPQALVVAPAALTVTRATGSAVQLADILGMLKKLHPASKSKATWVVADEVFGQLLDLFVNFGSATTGVTAPPNWLDYDADAGCWRLLGLPCYPHDHLPALGSTGDVMLADLRLMLAGDRGELTVERSAAGSGFISGTSSFRIRARIDARFWPQSTYTTAAGQTVSPLIILV